MNSSAHPDLHALTQAVQRAAQQSPAQRTGLRIQGAGTHDFYGESLQGEVLTTRGLAGVGSYEPSELVVTVGAGTSLQELEACLAEQGQALAFEPPHFGPGATVGGMVAAGLSGPARASVGAVRDYVLGLGMINGKGEHLRFGGQVMKNVAGYDVSRLMVGSMGSLGLITEVSLKVLPVAPAEAFLKCPLSQAKALSLLHQWGGQPLPLNASCWVQDSTQPGAPEVLFVRLRGAVAAVQAACVRMKADVQALGSHLSEQDSVSAAKDWADCRDQRLPFFSQPAQGAPYPSDGLALWRLSVPQTSPVLDLTYAPLIEWHGALRWVWAPLSAAQALRATAASVGGQASLFRRPHMALADSPVGVPVFTPLDAVQQRIQQALKNEFDPHGVFNPARLNSSF